MKHTFILLLALYSMTASAQSNFIKDTGNVSIGITPAPVGFRLSIHNAGAADQNLMRFVHTGVANSQIHLGTTSSTYAVTNQRNSSILESYRDLRLGAANAGNIYFETGRISTAAPVRMTITNSGSVGIGTETPASVLHVNGASSAQLASFTPSDVSGAFFRISNGTSAPGVFFPAIFGRSEWAGRSLGLMIVGEANDILPATDVTFAANVIQGRSKSQAPLAVNNVLAVNNYATNLLLIKANGNVGIGTTSPNYKLAVNGTIGARRVKVTQETWADFVFHDSYQLPSLKEVADYVKEHKHLPGIPTTAEVQKDGIDLGDMNAKLLQKVEELTLYLIQMKEENESMKARLKALENK